MFYSYIVRWRIKFNISKTKCALKGNLFPLEISRCIMSNSKLVNVSWLEILGNTFEGNGRGIDNLNN